MIYTFQDSSDPYADFPAASGGRGYPPPLSKKLSIKSKIAIKEYVC